MLQFKWDGRKWKMLQIIRDGGSILVIELKLKDVHHFGILGILPTKWNRREKKRRERMNCVDEIKRDLKCMDEFKRN